MKISILGCGWLGLPLAERLIHNGFLVNGSTTSQSKMPVLRNAGISPYNITLGSAEVPDKGNKNLIEFLKGSEVLIIDIPPKLKNITTASGKTFVEKIRILLPFIEKSSVKKVLFVSSTSVYGEDNAMVTEDTKPNPDTESGQQLLATEKLLQSNTHFKTTVLRFGGLIGEDRHPIKHLAGRENCENPDGPINLIHQEDCIGIIELIIERNCWGDVFNAVSPYHPSREKYYTEKATALSLPLPKFVYGKPSFGKVISSEKTEKILGYSFSKSNL
jgi:nucleoside-diphosphate-sugar epimerase